MSLPLERYARQAVLLEDSGQFEPVASPSILMDLDAFAKYQELKWGERMREARATAEFINMARGNYSTGLNYPPAASFKTKSISGTSNLYDGSKYAAIAANSIQAPTSYSLILWIKMTDTTSPGAVGFDPRISTSTTYSEAGTAITGTTFGASGNTTLTASITKAFVKIHGDVLIRQGGPAGKVMGFFHMGMTQKETSGVAGPAPVNTNLLFGGTEATGVDFTVLQAIQMGAVHTVTTIEHEIELLRLIDWS